jgi:hypothetical protein
MDEITSSRSGWALPTPGPTSRWDPNNTIERTKRQHLAALNQQLLLAKADLDVDSFRSILSEIENIKYGLDPRYRKAPPEVVTSPGITSAFSEDGMSNDENTTHRNDHKKGFKFSRFKKILRYLLFFRRRSRAQSGAQGMTGDLRNE